MSNWTPPKELTQAVPRRVKASGTFKISIVILILPFFFVMAFSLGPIYRDAEKMNDLKTRGVAATGEILGFHTERGSKGRIYYYADYGFKPAQPAPGQPDSYSVRTMVGEAMYPKLQTGEKVPVLYDPLDPSRSALNFDDRIHTTDPYASFYTLTKIMFGALGIPVVIAFAVFGWQYNKEKKLVMWGSLAEATIVAEEEAAYGRGGRATKMTYQFTDSGGRAVQGVRGGLPTKRDLKSRKSSDALAEVTANPTAIYDPRNSDKNILYPPVFVACVSLDD